MHHCQEVSIPMSWGSLAGKLWVPLSPSPKVKSGVLAIHGIFDNANSFDPLVPYLPPDVPILAIDLPGHGFSEHYHEHAKCYYFFDLITDMIEVLNYMSWERTILIGHSFGSLLALALGAILPEKISKIVMIEHPYLFFILNETFFQFLKDREYGELRHEPKIYPSREAVVDRMISVNQGLDRNSAETLSLRGCREAKGGFILNRDLKIINNGSVFDRFVFFQVKNKDFFKRLAMPTLILFGLESFETGTKFEDWISINNMELTPTTEVKYVNGNHHVHMNDPAKVGRVIREFFIEKLTSKL